MNRMKQAFVMFLLVLSSVETMLCALPAANNLYWPAVTIAMELWPWFIVVNTLGLLLTRLNSKVITAVFAIGFLLSVWPVFSLSAVTNQIETQWREQRIDVGRSPHTYQLMMRSFSRFNIPEVTPERFPNGTLFYSAKDASQSQLAPIIINIHGGGWHYGSPIDDHVFSSYLASKGYVIFSIPYRLAPQFTFPAQIDDVQNAIAWIHANASNFHADSTRIVLMGRSAGGNLALLAGYTSDIPIRGIIAFYPATDLAQMYRDPPMPDPHNVPLTIAEYLGGTPEQIPETYVRASPITFLRSGLPPTLQFQGTRDKIQKPRFPRELHTKLLQEGNVSLLVEFPWSHHSFDFVYFGPSGQLALYYAERFLQKTVNQPVRFP